MHPRAYHLRSKSFRVSKSNEYPQAMPNYRRAYVPGGTYFFTVVTADRKHLFGNAGAASLLGDVIWQCMSRHPFEMIAIVLLPDHLHALWSLPPGDNKFSMRWAWIKREFTREWLAAECAEHADSATKHGQRRRSVWQRQFWEHSIRDESDLEAHFNYIHYNPVKHGYVERPRDWPWSSFHNWVKRGHYPIDWASEADQDLPGNAGE